MKIFSFCTQNSISILASAAVKVGRMVRNISESVLLSDEDTAWLLLCFVWTGQMDGLQGEPGPAQHSLDQPRLILRSVS